MKSLKFFLLFIALFITTSCGIGDLVKEIKKSIKDVANSATALLEEINDISRHVDEKLESGQLTQEVADLIDGRLSNISGMLESTIQNSGGYIFDRLDGSVDNAFSELDKLLDELMAGVLGNYVPSIINQVGSQMQLQINTIAAAAEDLIIVTAGQTVYVMDKAFNGLIVTISIIVLAIGLIVFAIIFLRKGRKLTGANYIGVGLLTIFLAFFLVIILSPVLRGKILTGFNYGEALDIKEITPKITAVMPENIDLGKTKRIYIYGTHLNKLENISVKLTQGGAEKFQFPKATMIVNTSNRIVLGNLDKELKWNYPMYPLFKTAMLQEGIFNIITETQATQLNKLVNTARFTDIKPVAISVVHPFVPGARPAVTRAAVRSADRAVGAQVKKIAFDNISKKRKELAVSQIGVVKSEQYWSKIKDIFFKMYNIPEGDYGLVVFSDTTRIESPQFVTVSNPPPPVPNPDIFIMGMGWSDGLVPVAGQNATLNIRFGFSHPEQIKRSFNTRITTVPSVAALTVNVPMGKIAAATSGNQVVVTTNAFKINNPGTYAFHCSVDEQNEIAETTENNNTFSKTLKVGEYLYDVVLNNFSFESKESKNGLILDYSIVVDAGNLPTATCTKSLTLTNNMLSPLDCSFNLTGMRTGQTILLTFLPVIKVKVFGNYYITGNLEAETWQKELNFNTSQDDIMSQGRNYTFRGKMTITQRRSL